MNKRFALTTAGLAAATIGSTAAAELVNFTVHNDNYIGEDSWQISNSNGDVIASMYISGGYIYAGTSQSSTYSVSFGLWDSNASSPVSNGYRTAFTMDLAAGTYFVNMQDSWGDGWVWNSADGTDAFAFSGGANGVIAFTSGYSASGSFTVVPAPGALALLGLAGLTSRRKRK